MVLKLDENSNFKVGNLTLTEILSAWRDFFLNFCGPIQNFPPLQ